MSHDYLPTLLVPPLPKHVYVDVVEKQRIAFVKTEEVPFT
jgi:hypothetical protein